MIFAITAYAVIPNVPYLLWLAQYTPSRALINVDYLLLGLVSPFLGTVVLMVCFAGLAAIDAFVFIATLYHFTPRELVMSLSYARYNPVGFRDLPLPQVVMTVTAVGAAMMLARKARTSNKLPVSMAMGSILVTVVALDIGNGTNTFGPFTQLPFYSRTQHVPSNPANSALMAVDLRSFLPIGPEPAIYRASSALQAGARALPSLELSRNGTNVALLVVESWGQIDGQEALTRAIAAPLMSSALAERYTILVGSVPFHGSTTSAELRELCNIRVNYRDLFQLARQRCRTDDFRRRGYQVTGMHGFYGAMFDRASWWPRIGIDHRLFLDDFNRAGVSRRCGGAFLALCDDDLLKAMGDELRSPQQFVYGLTINSHLPLPPASDSDGGLRCSAMPIRLHDESCALAQRWRKVFVAVAKNAMRSDIKATQFVIVGDHSPPLLGSSDQGFSSTRVPFILLTPRPIEADRQAQTAATRRHLR